MRLDFRTVVFTMSFLTLVTFLLLGGYAALTKPRRRELSLWALAYASLVAGSLFIALRGSIPELLSILLGNSFILGFFVLIGAGLRAFRQKAPAWGFSMAILVASAAADILFTLLSPDLTVRMICYSSAVLALSLRCAYDSRGGLAEGSRPAAILVSAVLVGMAAIHVARIALILGLGAPADLMSGPNWDAIIQSLSGAFLIMLALALIILYSSSLNDALSAAARDRELLVREMAHRTKNDLALVDSLISLEQGAIGSACSEPDSSAVAERFEALRERIRCMAQAHDRLSMSEDPGRVSLDGYLEAVADGLPLMPGIAVERSFASVEVPFSLAAPLGLIMNELATNALKHAYPAGSGGALRLSLGVEPPSAGGIRATLEVRDRGVGVDWPPKNPGLGTAIVEALAAKLGGRLDYRYEGGSIFTLVFAIPLESRSLS
jgi:two-component sensor histidine kinase